MNQSELKKSAVKRECDQLLIGSDSNPDWLRKWSKIY